MFYNNKTVKNRFQGSEISNLQSVLINDKHYSIDQFKEFGGTVDFTYDEATKQVDVSYDLIHLDRNNNPIAKPYEPFSIPLKDVNEVKNSILKDINAQYLNNLKEATVFLTGSASAGFTDKQTATIRDLKKPTWHIGEWNYYE
jgi:hypothetical protein